MRLLHIAPHYGGGIAPAVVGIIEATNASHLLVEIERTKDSESLKLFQQFNLRPQNINSLSFEGPGMLQVDFVIFHFWHSHLWSQLAKAESVCLTRSSIFLNHQAFRINQSLVSHLGNLFDARVQSGFIRDGLPETWKLVPTCKSERSADKETLMRMNKAIYVGTLDYKKVSRDFFAIANELTQSKIAVDIYGNLLDAGFARDLKQLQNQDIQYKGYAINKAQIFGKATFLVYPLRSNHYGTTENILLEAMSKGVIPLVKRNPVETFILGNDLMNSLDIDLCLLPRYSRIFEDLEMKTEFSLQVRVRARELRHLKLREPVWASILNGSSQVLKHYSISEIANQIVFMAERFSEPNLPRSELK